MLKMYSSPFGGRARSRVLIALGLLESSYPRELERVLGEPLTAVRQALRGLECDGLVAGRSVGRTRVYQIDPRYFAASELRQYLQKLAEADTELRHSAAALRRRPRKTGKPV